MMLSLDKALARREKFDAATEARRARLDAQIQAAKDAEEEGALALVQGLIEKFGFTWERITSTRSRAAPSGRVGKTAGKVGKKKTQPPMSEESKKKLSDRMKERSALIKYRGPNGEEWSGMRLQPTWVKALIKRRGKKALEALITPEYKAWQEEQAAKKAA